MADNVAITAGSGTTIAADDIGGVLHQRVKISQGADGSATDVSSAAPLQVTLANTGANTNKILTTPDLPAGAATAAKQPALGTAGAASADVITVQGIASMTALKVDGSAVTQPVSGTVTATQGTATNLKAQAELYVGGTAVSTTNPVAIQPPASGHLHVDGDGTAGTPAAGVLTVQGVTSMTPIQVGDNSGSLTVDNAGTFAVQAAQSGTWTVQPGNTANTTAWKVDASSVAVPVTDNAGSLTVDNAGTFATQATLQTQTDTVMIGGVNIKEINAVTPLMGNGVTGTGSQRVTIASDNTVLPAVGAGATGSAVPANASYNGGNAATSLPTAATAGNLVGAMYDKYGRQVMVIGNIRDLVGTQTTTISASTSETTIVTAAASTYNDLVMLIVSNTSASTNTRIDFRDTTAGTVLFSLQSVGGAAPVGFALPVPIPQTSVNTNWTAQCSNSTTDIRIYAVFQKNK